MMIKTKRTTFSSTTTKTKTKTMMIIMIIIIGLSFFKDVNGREMCPDENQEKIDDQGFFSQGLKVEWDAHHLGWASAGIATFVATSVSLTNIYLHCSNYNKPLEQRQIVRILLMPAIYSLVSFFSYRFFREYVYFSVVRDIYEAFVLAAFLILCLLYVGRSPLEQQKVMAFKEKSKLSFPFCCFRYRPSKPNFLIATKWSVLQYVILRPLISAAAIVTDGVGVLCPSSYHFGFANVWLLIITFISATIALYGLLTIYHLAKEDLEGHRPLMKFMSIKVAVFLVFYQGFLISFLDHLGLIKPTMYWSKSNIADGINALATTIEMAFIAVFQLFAFPYTEYKAIIKGSEVDRRSTPWKNFLHSQDYRDFGRDIKIGIKFFINAITGRSKLNVRDPKDETNDLDFQTAFGLRTGSSLPQHHRNPQRGRFTTMIKMNNKEGQGEDDDPFDDDLKLTKFDPKLYIETKNDDSQLVISGDDDDGVYGDRRIKVRSDSNSSISFSLKSAHFNNEPDSIQLQYLSNEKFRKDDGGMMRKEDERLGLGEGNSNESSPSFNNDNDNNEEEGRLRKVGSTFDDDEDEDEFYSKSKKVSGRKNY